MVFQFARRIYKKKQEKYTCQVLRVNFLGNNIGTMKTMLINANYYCRMRNGNKGRREERLSTWEKKLKRCIILCES